LGTRGQTIEAAGYGEKGKHEQKGRGQVLKEFTRTN
jgi:hypothetical protein